MVKCPSLRSRLGSCAMATYRFSPSNPRPSPWTPRLLNGHCSVVHSPALPKADASAHCVPVDVAVGFSNVMPSTGCLKSWRARCAVSARSYRRTSSIMPEKSAIAVQDILADQHAAQRLGQLRCCAAGRRFAVHVELLAPALARDGAAEGVDDVMPRVIGIKGGRAACLLRHAAPPYRSAHLARAQIDLGAVLRVGPRGRKESAVSLAGLEPQRHPIRGLAGVGRRCQVARTVQRQCVAVGAAHDGGACACTGCVVGRVAAGMVRGDRVVHRQPQLRALGQHRPVRDQRAGRQRGAVDA